MTLQSEEEEEQNYTLQSVLDNTVFTDIYIEVTHMRLVEDKLNAYVLFDVSGQDKHGPFEVGRRYRHFYKLR